MGRPPTRTKQLLRDDMVRMKELFGTPRNAYSMLALEGQINYASFCRALNWLPVTPEEADIIQERWDAWCDEFLKINPPTFRYDAHVGKF